MRFGCSVVSAPKGPMRQSGPFVVVFGSGLVSNYNLQSRYAYQSGPIQYKTDTPFIETGTCARETCDVVLWFDHVLSSQFTSIRFRAVQEARQKRERLEATLICIWKDFGTSCGCHPHLEVVKGGIIPRSQKFIAKCYGIVAGGQGTSNSTAPAPLSLAQGVA